MCLEYARPYLGSEAKYSQAWFIPEWRLLWNTQAGSGKLLFTAAKKNIWMCP